VVAAQIRGNGLLSLVAGGRRAPWTRDGQQAGKGSVFTIHLPAGPLTGEQFRSCARNGRPVTLG
jgi:hypothetical protein